MQTYSQVVPFRLIQMPCCGATSCWVNSRLANYCPECGEYVFAKLKTQGDLIVIHDTEAELKYRA